MLLQRGSGNEGKSRRELLHFDTLRHAMRAANSANESDDRTHTSTHSSTHSNARPRSPSPISTPSTSRDRFNRGRSRERSTRDQDYRNRRPSRDRDHHRSRSRSPTQERGCYICSSKEHQVRDCPKRQSNGAPSVAAFEPLAQAIVAAIQTPQLYPQAPPNFGPPPSMVPMPMIPQSPAPHPTTTSGTLMNQRRTFPSVATGNLSPTRSPLFCLHCQRTGHIREHCYNLHGMPTNVRGRPQPRSLSPTHSLSPTRVVTTSAATLSPTSTAPTAVTSGTPLSSLIGYTIVNDNGVPKLVAPSTAQTNAVYVSDFVNTHNLARTSTVFCIHTQRPDMVLTTLLDSGATHSCISPQAVQQLGLTITPPTGPVKEVKMADGKTVIPRIGTVLLDLHVFFFGVEQEKRPVRMRMNCEVMPCHTDLIFGVNALRTLFPNDSLTSFFIPPSVLASVPVPLTVEYDFDPTLGTVSKFVVRPEGHLSYPSRRTRMEAVVDALDIVEEVSTQRKLFQNAHQVEEVPSSSGLHDE